MKIFAYVVARDFSLVDVFFAAMVGCTMNEGNLGGFFVVAGAYVAVSLLLALPALLKERE